MGSRRPHAGGSINFALKQNFGQEAFTENDFGGRIFINKGVLQAVWGQQIVSEVRRYSKKAQILAVLHPEVVLISKTKVLRFQTATDKEKHIQSVLLRTDIQLNQ